MKGTSQQALERLLWLGKLDRNPARRNGERATGRRTRPDRGPVEDYDASRLEV